MHSKAKLALGVLTSPKAAFEEIMERKLLGTAFVIVALTGVMAMVGALTRVHTSGPIQWFALGKDNPLTWFGLYLLYALAIKTLVKWLGTEIRYTNILLGLGWAQVSLLLAYGIGAVAGLLTAGGVPDESVSRYVGPAQTVLELAYLALCGAAISVAGRTTFLRGLLSYFVIQLAAVIGFTQTYAGSRLNMFRGALPGIAYLAQTVVGADNIPWLGAAVVGYVLGFWHVARDLEWDTDRRNRLIATAAVIGLAAFGIYTYTLYKTDYYGQLLSAQSFYERDKFAEAALRLRALVPASKIDAPRVMLDIGGLYYLASKDALSLRYYRKSIEALDPLNLMEAPMLRAEAYSGMGAVRDMQGNYPSAISYFTKARAKWPEFREPWVRMAITYDRMGDYKKAIESADHAVQKLGSEAKAVQVALIEAYARIGDAKNAKAAFDKVEESDKDLAKRIGSQPQAWSSAVAKLTRSDLRFPLEASIVPPPQRDKPGAKTAKKSK